MSIIGKQKSKQKIEITDSSQYQECYHHKGVRNKKETLAIKNLRKEGTQNSFVSKVTF